jgi:undecaprenyl-diphosphatase
VAALSYLEACVIGALQGVAELFPISSLGHSVLVPALVGGSWARHLRVDQSEGNPYLAFIVLLHVATAAALLVFFWRDWVRIIGGFFTSVRDRQIVNGDQRLAWLIILGTIPVGLVGLTFEHQLRTHFGTPLSASIFLMVNGALLYGGEQLRRRVTRRAEAIDRDELVDPVAADNRLARMPWRDGFIIGASQIAGLFPGVSRSGATMTGGLLRGLSHEDSARFAFLLATPIILAAGVLKIGDLTDPKLNDHGNLYGPFIVGAVLSGIGAYLAVRFLLRYFETRTLTPFAIYCFLFGAACTINFA